MVEIEQVLPSDIEKRSMEIIEAELEQRIPWTPQEKLVVKRVIHTTADFDYGKNLKFSKDGVTQGLKALKEGAVIVTDTNMGASGISKPAIKALGCQLHCFMADEDVAQAARTKGSTRAVASMDKAVALFKDRPLIFAIGNAPTALIRLYERVQEGSLKPRLIIGAPVGFVNVIQSKELIQTCDVPFIVAAGRKGGSNVAAAICNALLYQLYNRN